MKMKKLGIYAVCAFGGLLGFNACKGSTHNEQFFVYPSSVQKVLFDGDTTTVHFENLHRHDIYLVKVNTSVQKVNAADTGKVQGTDYRIVNDEFATLTVDMTEAPDTMPLIGHPAAREFDADLPPFNPGIRRLLQVDFIPPVVGDKRNFWVEDLMGSNNFVQKQATLRASGSHGNVWVMDESTNDISEAQANTLAEQFDILYPASVNILGYEYGGGPDGDGGRDGDPKIQILLYEIINASKDDAAVGGYYWSKDYYWQSQISYSNEAEIFYVNTSIVNEMPDFTLSVLVHELQHMINFNQKNVKHGKNSATWYNEMLSMMAEDIISPLVGVGSANTGHPIRRRIPRFLESYHLVGITEWDSGKLVYPSYAKSFAFGAYLLRNYGGAELLQKILANNVTNIESVSAALNEISPGLDFEKALLRFGEAMVYSGSIMPEGVLTFDLTITSTINQYTYTAYGFDIWNTNRQSPTTQYGPLVFDISPMDMRGYSILLHSSLVWKKRTGNYSITLERPVNPNIEFYVMVR